MKNFIVYNSDGDILRSGVCMDTDFDKQAKSGQFVLEGKASDANQKIVDGKVVNKDAVSKSNEEIMEEGRARRTTLLEICDWTQVTDSALTAEKKTEWATYRQALRDITDHSNVLNLSDSDWPTKPS